MTCTARGIATVLAAGACLALVPVSSALARTRAASPRSSPLAASGTLSIHMVGRGHVTSDPAGIDCTDGAGACEATFPTSTIVTFTGTPHDGYVSSALGECLDSTTCTVMVSATPLVVDAGFDIDSSLWIEVSGQGEVRVTPLNEPTGSLEEGAKTCNLAGWVSPTANLNCTLHVEPGRQVLLETVPNGTNSTLIAWSDPACGDQPTCIVTMPTSPEGTDGFIHPYDSTVVASFSPVWIGVLASVVGGGTISSTPPDLFGCTLSGDTVDTAPASCSQPIRAFTTLTLHAASAGPVAWEPGTCEISPIDPADCTLTATTGVWLGVGLGTTDFPSRVQGGPEVLIRFRIRKTGSGAGSVTASGRPSCGSTCVYDATFGTLGTLTATPAPGSRFAGWQGGGCSGSGDSCTLTYGAATGIIANFEPTAPPTTTTEPVVAGTTVDTTTTTTSTAPTSTSGTVTTARATPSFTVPRDTIALSRHGRRRSMIIRVTTSLPSTAKLTIRGPRGLMIHRFYARLSTQRTLTVALPLRTRPGRYRVTLMLEDRDARTRIVRPAITVRA